MRKIVDYDIISSHNDSEVIEEIQKRLKYGYEPVGGLAIVNTPQTREFYQAVVKYEESSKD